MFTLTHFNFLKKLCFKKFIPRIITNMKIFVLGERRDAVWGPSYQKDSDSRREADLTVQTGRGRYMMLIIKKGTLGMVFNALRCTLSPGRVFFSVYVKII